MKYVPLSALPVSAETQVMLVESIGIAGCVVFERNGETAVSVFGPACDHESLAAALAAQPAATMAWERVRVLHAPGRTARALGMLAAQPGLAPYAAAAACQVHVAAVYRAIKRQAARGNCTHCGQLLPAQS